MNKEKTIQTYEPIGHAFGLMGTIRLAAKEIHSSRHIIWHMFKRDFMAQFRQRIMGYLWIVIAPFMAIIPFIFLYRVGIFNPGQTAMPYPVFIVMGMGIWGFLTNTFIVVSGGLQNNHDLIMRTNIPKITFALTGLANTLYSVVVHCLVIFVFLLIMGVTPSIWGLLYPLALLPIVICGVGLGLMFCVIGAVAKDLSTMMISFLNLLLFLSPVVYKPEFNHPVLSAIISWNPFTYLVDIPRSFLVLGEFQEPRGYFMATAFSLIILAGGIHSFYLIKEKVAERL